MSGLSFLSVNWFYQNFKKLAKKVVGPGFEGTKDPLFGDSN